MAKKVQAIARRSFKAELKKLIKKYEKVTVIFSDCDSGYRKRLIESDGSCFVSYRGNGYRKWSRYQQSCFMDYAEDIIYKRDRNGNLTSRDFVFKPNLNATIKAMIEHDDENYYDKIVPLEIRYGVGFKKKLYIIHPVR